MVTEEIKGNAEFPYELSAVGVASDEDVGIAVIQDSCASSYTTSRPKDEYIQRVVELYDLWIEGDQDQSPLDFIKDNW